MLQSFPCKNWSVITDLLSTWWSCMSACLLYHYGLKIHTCSCSLPDAYTESGLNFSFERAAVCSMHDDWHRQMFKSGMLNAWSYLSLGSCIIWSSTARPVKQGNSRRSHNRWTRDGHHSMARNHLVHPANGAEFKASKVPWKWVDTLLPSFRARFVLWRFPVQCLECQI